MIWCLLCFSFQSLKNNESAKQDGCSGSPHVWHFTTTAKDYVLLYVFLNLQRVGGCVCMELSEQEKILCMGVCVECAGIITCDGEASPRLIFSLAIFAGVNGENSGRARSDWPACHFGAQWENKTEKHDFNESVCSREEKKPDAQALSAPQNHPPLEQWRKGGTRCLKLIFLSLIFETPLQWWSCFSWPCRLGAADRGNYLWPLRSGQVFKSV